jgi:thioredoxin-like negative regulator of GroEL
MHQAIAARVGLGLTLAQAGRAREALPLLERAAALSRERFGAGHWRTGEAELAQAIALVEAGEVARAESPLREAAGKIESKRRAQPRLRLQLDATLARLRGVDRAQR